MEVLKNNSKSIFNFIFRYQVHNNRFLIATCQRNVRFYSDYPDHIKVQLPALSPTMETGTIISWAKKEGKQPEKPNKIIKFLIQKKKQTKNTIITQIFFY